jgi:hypothetical protein
MLEEPRTRPRNRTTKAEVAGGRPSAPTDRQTRYCYLIPFARSTATSVIRLTYERRASNSWSRTQIARSREARPLIFCARATMH